MLYEKILHGAGNSFSHKFYPHFTMPWHFHPEFELILIVSGHGKRFVGDTVESFSTGDLVLLGENLPHFHMCDGLYANDEELYSSSEVIQFKKDIFPQAMEQIQEYAAINDLLERSRHGIKFTSPPERENIRKLMAHIDKLTGIKRITGLMRILDILGRMKEYKLITGTEYFNSTTQGELNDPIDIVFTYLNNNFKENISLEDIAAQAGFNPSSLCRYFKKRVQKSIFESLNELRIGFACKLIANSDYTISQIAYESGYRNIANFNRQFKKTTKLSPSEYRRLYKN